jgi:hypothetical protein
MNQMKHATMQADDRNLRQRAEEIRSLVRRSVEDIIKIGRLLTDVKKRLAHGRWLPWLERELGWSDDTALNFMRVYRLSRRPIFRKFRHSAAKLAPSVLYTLAKGSDAAYLEIMERVASGEKITPAKAKLITVQTRSYSQPIVAPYTVVDIEPGKGVARPTLKITHAEPRQVAPLTSADMHRAHIKGGANRLIDALVLQNARPEMRAKAVELVFGERQRDRDAFVQAVRELAAALDRRASESAKQDPIPSQTTGARTS